MRQQDYFFTLAGNQDELFAVEQYPTLDRFELVNIVCEEFRTKVSNYLLTTHEPVLCRMLNGCFASHIDTSCLCRSICRCNRRFSDMLLVLVGICGAKECDGGSNHREVAEKRQSLTVFVVRIGVPEIVHCWCDNREKRGDRAG